MFIICNKYIKHYIYFILFLFGLKAFSQKDKTCNISKFIKQNSVSFEDPSDLKNFSYLKNVLKDKRIVILAEANHGHGTSYLAISNLTRFLIDELNFTTVVFEQGIVDVSYLQKRLLIEDSIRNGYVYLNSFFIDRKDGFQLLPYLQKGIKNSKLKLFGIDFQIAIDGAIQCLIDDTEKFIPVNSLYLKDDEWVSFVSLLKMLPSFGYNSYLNDANTNLITKYSNIIIDSLLYIKSSKNEEISMLIRQWRNINSLVKWLNRRFQFKDKKITPKRTTTYYAARDSAMAGNLIWAIDSLIPYEKIIVNVSAYHASKSTENIEGFTKCCKDDDVKTFGELLSSSKYKNDIYSIAFICSKGFSGVMSNEVKKIPLQKKNSLEYYFSKSKFKYAFIDFEINKYKCEWLNQSFYMSPFFDKYYNGKWGSIFDGVFYINEMKPNIFFRY